MSKISSLGEAKRNPGFQCLYPGLRFASPRLHFLIFITFLFFSTPAVSLWSGRILQVSTQKEISLAELTTDLANTQIIILGEKHNTPAIQFAQSEIMNQVVSATHKEGQFTTAWEFLNYTDQEKINIAYVDFISGKIDALHFLIETQGTTHDASYIPILETTKSLRGNIIGVNISREAKEPILKGGINALDPTYLPPNFALGSAGYHQRFVEMMSDHVSANVIENYYAAQCLTDDIMAYTLQREMDLSLVFLITGSFHADYYDGVVSRINVRLSGKSVAVVRLIDASDYDEKELKEMLHHRAYGDIADYVYFVNEPLEQSTNYDR